MGPFTITVVTPLLKHQNEALLASVSDTAGGNVHKQYDWDTDPS